MEDNQDYQLAMWLSIQQDKEIIEAGKKQVSQE